MIDVVYILGSGSKASNAELRYSLRSLEAYGHRAGRVCVVGTDPGFLSANVLYVPMADYHLRNWNHANKVRRFFELQPEAERVLLNYDDNILLDGVDLEDYPFYQCGDLKDGTSRYKVSTLSFLNAKKAPTGDFEVHAPIIYERDKFLGLTPVFERAKRVPFCIRSTYCNMNRIEGTPMEDCKLGSDRWKVSSVDAIKSLATGRHVVSLSDKAIEAGALRWLETLFPNKSRYEA